MAHDSRVLVLLGFFSAISLGCHGSPVVAGTGGASTGSTGSSAGSTGGSSGTATGTSGSTGACTGPALPFLVATSVDTMKLSRDRELHSPLDGGQIAQAVEALASLGTNYISVDTHWDYLPVAQVWVADIRAAGKHVWFRGLPIAWENNNDAGGAGAVQSPSNFLASEGAFLRAGLDAGIFADGDIFDAASEPENGHWWKSPQAGFYFADGGQTAAMRKAYLDAYNQFIVDTTDTARDVFSDAGLSIEAGIRSTNDYIAGHPDYLYPATVNHLGYLTLDSYPEESNCRDSGPPSNALVCDVDAGRRAAQLVEIHDIRLDAGNDVPIVIGEMGYSNRVSTTDAAQRQVLDVEFDQLSQLPFLGGINYWVGPGHAGLGGYTYVVTDSPVGSYGGWTIRPAGADLATFFACEGERGKLR